MDLRTHLKMVALALVVACGLWMGVHNEDRITVPLTVPLIYEHPPDVVRLSGREDVDVRVRTSRGRGRTVSKADVTVRVDNRDGLTGRRTEVLSTRQAEASFGVEVISIEPARFVVEYDRRISRPLPVRVLLEGEPAEGYRIDRENVRAEPARVPLEGPATILGELEHLDTAPVQVGGLSSTVRVKNLALEPPDGRLRLTGPQAVSVAVPIVPVVGTRVFEDVPLTVLRGEWETTPPNPDRLQATVEGPLPALKDLPVSAILLTVDLRGKDPQAGDYQVEVLRGVDQSLCPGCSVKLLSPQRAVDVRVFRTRREAAPAGAEGQGPSSIGADEEKEAARSGAARTPAGLDRRAGRAG